MGLFTKYNKTTASNGDIIYSKSPDFKKTAKEIAQKGRNIPEEIEAAKSQLEEKVKYKTKITSQALNPNKAAERGVQAKGREDDIKTTQKEIDSLVKKLSRLGVKVRTELLPRGKVVYYEGGHDNMFTTTDLKKFKLEVFEETASGNISKDLCDYMIISLEAAMKETSKYEAYMEKVNAIIDSSRRKYVKYVNESFEAGLITDLQKDVMLELAEDNFMFEDAKPDRIPELVNAFIEAAKEGNEDKKEAIKEQIDSAKELKEAEKELDEEVVEEGANCSIVEKLEAIKAKLTPEEKEMAKRFDEMLAEGNTEEAEEPEEDKKEEKPEGAEEGEETPEEPAKEEKDVKESVLAAFESVGVKSSVTTEDADLMMEFMTEAVDDNVYSNADRLRIERILKNR